MGSVERIDGRDEIIIDMLSKNARCSLREIARKVKMSPSSVRNRMERLCEAGFVKRYTVDIDYRKLGYEIQVIILVTCKPGLSQDIYTSLKSFEEVGKIFWTSGPANFICIVRLRDMAELSSFMTGKLEKLNGVERLETMFLMPNPDDK